MIRLLLGVVLIPLAASAACVTATPECTEWVTLGGGPAKSMIYRSQSLQVPNSRITRAFIMIHGTNRDAENYYRTALAAAFLAGALENTVVIAPRIASNDPRGCRDTLADNEVSYACTGDSWRSGGVAAGGKWSSFDFVDELIRILAERKAFPNLKAIVLAGHSAGGQFVNRYEMANKVHESLAVPVSYVVANPSSYAYLDATRPDADSKEFRPFSDARNCTTFNRWPYGLENKSGYVAAITEDHLRKQLASRPTTYLLGELDTTPLASFDSSCPAMAQGASRLARGQAFATYVNQKFGAKHTVEVVPLCGHNARCMFTSDVALKLVFGGL